MRSKNYGVSRLNRQILSFYEADRMTESGVNFLNYSLEIIHLYVLDNMLIKNGLYASENICVLNTLSTNGGSAICLFIAYRCFGYARRLAAIMVSYLNK